jgi:hypothetical protein
MLTGKVISAVSSQDQPIFTYAAANVANAGGTGAITTAVSFPTTMAFPLGFPTNNYIVQVTPNQFCVASVTNKTQAGFNVVLSPVTITGTLAAGTFDLTVIG